MMIIIEICLVVVKAGGSDKMTLIFDIGRNILILVTTIVLRNRDIEYAAGALFMIGCRHYLLASADTRQLPLPSHYINMADI